MAELGGDSPPPLPGSPPPLEDSQEDLRTGRVSSRSPSEKFRALQKMINSSPNMYSAKIKNGMGAPPTKRQHMDAYEEPAAGESPKLTHRTLDRPKRKSRVPSRGKLRERALQSQPGDPTVGAEDSNDANAQSTLPGLLPPLPDSAPPKLPSVPPPSLSNALLDAHSALTNNVSAPPTRLQEMPGSPAQTYSREDGQGEDARPTILNRVSNDDGKELTAHSPVANDPPKREDASILMSESTSTSKMGTPSLTTASEAKKAAIGSFSERLKKIRETRTTKTTSPLSKTISLPSHETRTRPSLQTASSLATPSPISEHSSFAFPSGTSTPSTGDRNKSMSRVAAPSSTDSNIILTQNSAALKSQSEEQAPTQITKSSSDLLPPVTPSLLSPDFDSPTVGDTHTQASSPPYSNDVSSKKNNWRKKPGSVDSLRADSTANKSLESYQAVSGLDPKPLGFPQSEPQEIEPVESPDSLSIGEPLSPLHSSETGRKRDEWRKQKSRPVNSVISEPILPQAVTKEIPSSLGDAVHAQGNKTNDRPETDVLMPPAEPTNLQISASSESLPGLPDSPPPDLPSSPPPDLADVMEAISETSLILDTAIPPEEAGRLSTDTREASVSSPLDLMVTHQTKTLPTRREVVQVRLSKPDTQSNTWQRSVDKCEEEPRLSLKERRALTLEASRRPNAVMKTVLSTHVADSKEVSPSHQESTSETRPTPTIQMEDPSDDEKILEGLPPPPPPPSLPPPSDSELQVETDGDTEPSVEQATLTQKRIRSSSSISSGSKERLQQPRQTLSSGPRDISHTVKVISEGETIHSPDFKVTRVAKKRWRKSQPVYNDLQSSASTGDIVYRRPRFGSLGQHETSSLKSLTSSSESLSFEEAQQFHKTSTTSPLLVSRAKDQSVESIPEQNATLEGDPEKKRQKEEQRSSFLESILSDIPSTKQPSTYSSSSQEDLLGSPVQNSYEEIAKMQQRNEDQSRAESKSPGPDTIPVVEDSSKTEHGNVSPSVAGVERREGRRGRRRLRNVDSLIIEASIHRKALEEDLQGRMSVELASLGRLQQEQGQLLEEQLAEIREQQRLTRHLLKGDSHSTLSQTPQASPGALRPPTIYLDRDLFETLPEQWSVNEVCQWLEVMGLGAYKGAFREKQITGATLLSMDVQLFTELGIDSPEIREIFLARIYELGNPDDAGAEMEDDFMLSVDSYTPEDWNKFQAAVNALKSPILDESVELAPSAVGQFLHHDCMRTQSMPSFDELESALNQNQSQDMNGFEIDENSSQPTSSGYPLPTSNTIHSFPHYALMETTPDHTPNGWSSGSPLNRRGRSNTDPTLHNVHLTAESEAKTPAKGKRVMSLGPNEEVSQRISSKKKTRVSLSLEPDMTQSEMNVLRLARDLSEGAITFEGGQYKNRKQSGRKESTIKARRPSYWERPPTGQERGIVRLYMDTVQEGLLYKAFLVTYQTTVEEMIGPALEKAHLSEDPGNYCVWETSLMPGVPSRVLDPSETPLHLQTQWPQFNSYRFELRLKKDVQYLMITVDLPGQEGRKVSVAMAATTTSLQAIHLLLLRLQLPEEGVGWAIVEQDTSNKTERVLGEEECPLALQSSWENPVSHELKLVPMSGTVVGIETEHDQQELAERTVHDLRTQVASLTQEGSHREQLLSSVRTERDRLTREHQAKDTLVAALESDLERYKSLQSPTADKDSELTALEQSLAAHEKALKALRVEHQIQATELRTAEEEVEGLRATLLKKEEQIAQLSESTVPGGRPSLHLLLAPRPPQYLLAMRVEPTPQGLGIKVAKVPSSGSGREGGGCVVKEIADFCSTTKLRPGDWLLEINGIDVSSKPHREVGSFLQSYREPVKLVVSRPLSPEALEAANFPDPYGIGSPSGMVIERFKKLNASLSAQLDSQSAEVERWRQESESLKTEVLKYSNAQKDKESDLKLLQSTVQDLKQQLEESEKSRLQLRETLREVEGSRSSQQQAETLETSLRERERELTRSKAAERERRTQIKVLQKERDNAISALRQHAVAKETAELPQPGLHYNTGSLAKASRSEILAALRAMESDFARHRTYLDQLLAIIIDQNPKILTMMGEAQKLRDQNLTESEDSWC